MPESLLFKSLKTLRTEQINLETSDIDILPVRDILCKINNEDRKVADAVREVIPEIESAVNFVVNSFSAGARLIYVGAGTSGRLGIIDAAECPPTFGTNPQQVMGIIAGGREAMFAAQEGAEDKPELGANDLKDISLSKNDTVCGIAASGRTPYVKGALEYANNKNCKTILISTSSKTHIIEAGLKADVIISVDTGAEVIAGSTRMKSGTAQKMILNMISTASMIRMGKTLGNVMIDLQLTNTKLKERAKKIIMEATAIGYDDASDYLTAAKYNVKTALVMIFGNVDYDTAKKNLEDSAGFVKLAIQKLNKDLNL